MKTKNKVVALFGISIVLCSLFLVALPATTIAAEQDDFVLSVYGNANEDDTIDMRDLTYVKLIFFGKKSETELADAKYDGKINPLDFIQIKLIIVGKEKELTIVDTADRIETLNKPIRRIVGGNFGILRSLGIDLKDIVVGRYSQVDLAVYPELSSKLLDVGSGWTPDIEKILGLNPNAVFLQPPGGPFDTTPTLDKLESAGISVLCFKGQTPEIHREEVKKLGYIFDRCEEAEKYLDWRGNIMNSITEKVELIPEEDKVKVYFESYKPYTTYPRYGYIAETGGKDIFAGEPGGSVDPEAVIDRNPDIIVKVAYPGGGFDKDADDTAELKALRDEIMSRVELQEVAAVKNGRVYVITSYLLLYLPHCNHIECFQMAYLAKWFHPELFENLDPKAIHQEYLTEFQRMDIDLDKQGVFVYPEPT
jgi:iron complex transport system substrate-binding protein